jgi:hypothetical protein
VAARARAQLLIEQAVSDGELKGQKTNRPPRTVDLLAPLKHDLAEWRLASGRPPPDAFLFPGAAPDRPWRDHDYRNWRKRHFRSAAQAAGLPNARPYDLRHSFASLMLHEGRVGVVDLASQLGHSPTMTLNTYGHVIAELREGRGRAPPRPSRVSAETPPKDPTNDKRDSPTTRRSRRTYRADTRTRTGDPFITSEVLYQLSYVGLSNAG